MRILIPLILLGSAGSAAAGSPIPLVPFESGIGFSPEGPRPIGAEHPLFRRVALAEVRQMPRRIGSLLMPVTSAREFESALRETLAGANMLAASEQEAKARLNVTWRRFDLPFHIGFSSRAMVAIHYELSRADDGQVIFSREIVTRAESRGGEASARARGTGRAAILSNIASFTLCLDKAAFGRDPADCALRPVGRFSAPITVVTPIYR